MIKAIETQYKGYRFRSRLEARWAVFFDALDIKWEYEKEGYALKPYKFSESAWMNNYREQMKGADNDLLSTVKELTRKFKEISSQTIFYLPDFWLPEIQSFAEVKPDDWKNMSLIELEKAMRLVNETKYPLLMCGEFSGCIRAMGPSGVFESGLRVEFLNFHPCMERSKKLEEAIIAAKSARFEHGEKPFKK
jgi:hypothetical protein